jgi:hypothetical protein
MFEKRKEKRAVKKNKDVAALIDWQEQYLEQIDEKIATAGSVTDAAEKILQLRSLGNEIQSADYNGSRKQTGVVNKRANKKWNIAAGTGAPVAAAAAVVPVVAFATATAPVFVPAVIVLGLASAVFGIFPATLASGRFDKTARRKLLEQNPDLSYFGNILAAQKTRVQEMLDDTIKNCNLEEISLSPCFREAVDSTSSLRDRFTEAAVTAAQKAQEEKIAAQQTPAPVKKTSLNSDRVKRLGIN